MHALRPHHTYREYLALEAASNVRHEFHGGVIYAMAGGTPEHAALAAAVIATMKTQLRGRCQVYTSDLRVRVEATGLSTYPDVTIVCGPLIHDPESTAAIMNPTMVVEVLSDSTAAYDRTEKRAHYQRIPALRAIVLVSHDERCLEAWTRDDTTWVRSEARGRGTLALPELGCTLDVDALYDAAAV